MRHSRTIEQAELTEQLVIASRRFVEREVIPVASKYEHANEYPKDLVERMKELKVFGARSRRNGAASGTTTHLCAHRRGDLPGLDGPVRCPQHAPHVTSVPRRIWHAGAAGALACPPWRAASTARRSA
jgi:alkylation response protein AidB-like acyl-CoA dehydrogenase